MSFPTQINNEQQFRVAFSEFLGDINVGLEYTNKFLKDFLRLDNSIRQIFAKQIKSLLDNSNRGKPMSYDYKGEKAVRVKRCYRLHFEYNKKENVFTLISCYHKDKQ